MKLIVVIPALDEEATIEPVIRGIPGRIDGIDQVEVLVVDDGSSDRTAELARAAGARVAQHGENRGVGAAFATGLRGALDRGADLIVNMDGDGQFDPGDIPELIRPVLDGTAGFVTCTRFGRRDYVPTMPWLKRAGNWGMARLISRIVGKRFSDVSCGFRCYSRDTALRLNLFGRFTYTQESFISLAGQGVVMSEVPLRVRGVREHGRSRVADNLVRYGFRAGAIILRALRDHRPLAFFGGLGAGSLVLGGMLGAFVFIHWLQTGGTSPYRSVLLGSAAFVIVGIVMEVLALLADMLGRMRRTNEAILYELRRRRGEDDRGGEAR